MLLIILWKDIYAYVGIDRLVIFGYTYTSLIGNQVVIWHGHENTHENFYYIDIKSLVL